MTEPRKKVGRPFKADKKKYLIVRVDKTLGDEVEKFIPVYSDKVNFKVSVTHFIEKSIRECLDREKGEV
jgi:hypothetical protein|tara:strand:- start:3777 stop:3983 length:207 start_codon:yes stop_codon:yes gene_type:complete